MKISEEKMQRIYFDYGLDETSKKMDYALDMDENVEETLGYEINANIISNLHEVRSKTKEIKVIILIKTNFFNQHKHILWKKMGLEVDDYYEEVAFEDEAKRIFNEDFMTKDDFIH